MPASRVAYAMIPTGEEGPLANGNSRILGQNLRKGNRTIVRSCTHYGEVPGGGWRRTTAKKQRSPTIHVRHEFTGEDSEDVQVGLRLWARFVVEEIRKVRPQAGTTTEATKDGRPA